MYDAGKEVITDTKTYYYPLKGNYEFIQILHFAGDIKWMSSKYVGSDKQKWYEW